MKNASQTGLLLLFAICGVTMVAARESVMPLIFHSKNNAISFKDDIYSTQSTIINKFVNSLTEAQNPSETAVLTIRTPSAIVGTINLIKQHIDLLPALNKLINDSFMQSASYDASAITQELVNALDAKNINMTVSQLAVDLADLADVEKLIKQASQENTNMFVIFAEDSAAAKPAVSSTPKGRKLQDATYNPTMLQIPSETLYGLILTFLLFLPLLYIGISMLYGIQTPEKFATMNLVVGREY